MRYAILQFCLHDFVELDRAYGIFTQNSTILLITLLLSSCLFFLPSTSLSMSTFLHTTGITLSTLLFHRLTLFSPSVSTTLCSPSDHFPVFSELPLNRTPLPPPTSHSFRRLHSIDTDSFLSDLKSPQLITNPPDSLDCLLTAYSSVELAGLPAPPTSHTLHLYPFHLSLPFPFPDYTAGDLEILPGLS